MASSGSARSNSLPDVQFPSVIAAPQLSVPCGDTWVFEAGQTGFEPSLPWLSLERGRVAEWRFGDLVLVRETGRTGASASGLMRSASMHGQGCVALVWRDEATPGTLVISPRASLALAVLDQSDRRLRERDGLLALFMPRDFLERTRSGAAGLFSLVATDSGPGSLLAGFLRQLGEQPRQVDGEQAKCFAAAARALVAACLAPADADGASPPPFAVSGMVERARQMVQRHMASPDFGPPQLGRLLAMSRSKLYRLLDGDGGVAQFINRERLIQARRALEAPCEPRSVQAIANEVGFRDHSTFSRAFRREYGCSPTELRRRALLGRGDTERLSLAPSDPHPGSAGCCRACATGRENGMNRPDLGF